MNFGHPVSYVTAASIIAGTLITIVILEASGQHSNHEGSTSTSVYKLSAAKYELCIDLGGLFIVYCFRLGHKGMLFIVPLSAASWLMGSIAVYTQNVGMYGSVSAVNASLGAAIFAFHSLSNDKVQSLLHSLIQKLPFCRS